MAELAGDRAAQSRQQRIEQRDVLPPRRRALQQYRTKAFAQDRDSLGEDAREADLVERFGRVGQSAVRLHAEAEVRRRLGSPLEKRRFGRRAVEAAVQLDAVEPLGVVAKHLRAGQGRWIELALPGRVAEAGRAG